MMQYMRCVTIILMVSVITNFCADQTLVPPAIHNSMSLSELEKERDTLHEKMMKKNEEWLDENIDMPCCTISRGTIGCMSLISGMLASAYVTHETIKNTDDLFYYVICVSGVASTVGGVIAECFNADQSTYKAKLKNINDLILGTTKDD